MPPFAIWFPPVGLFSTALAVVGAIVAIIALQRWKRIVAVALFALLGIGEAITIFKADAAHRIEVAQMQAWQQRVTARLDEIINTPLSNERQQAAVKLKREIAKPPNIAIAPNGIANAAPNFGNQTVNNTLPDRRLSDDQKNELANCLRENPGKFTVAALQNNREAYRFAQDWYDVFSAAKWSNEQPIPIAIFSIGGGMFSGVRISVAGNWDDSSKSALLLDGSPEKDALACLKNKVQVGGVAIPYKDKATGTIRIDVSEQPKP